MGCGSASRQAAWLVRSFLETSSLKHMTLVWIILVLPGVFPKALIAQTWELDIRRTTIDHDHTGYASGDGDQIPSLFGMAGRHAWTNGVFVGIELSLGSETRPGAVCGGFIFDPSTQCIDEVVRYSGGLVAAFVGHRAHLSLGSRWAVGGATRVGSAILWALESGSDTGRSLAHAPFAAMAGLAGDLSHVLPGHGMVLRLSIGGDYLLPIGLSGCADCWQPLQSLMQQTTIALGVGWDK